MKTKLLYMDQNNLFEHTAKIIDVTIYKGKTAVVLDETILYAQGGGQPADNGLIKSESGTFEVTDVRFDNGAVYHVGEFSNGSFETGTTVTIEVNKVKRTLYSRLHSAGHLVDSGVSKIGLDNLIATKGYHFEEGPYVEYQGDISKINIEETIKKLEKTLNEMISVGFETKIKSVTKEELTQLCDTVPDYLPEGKPIRAVLVWSTDWIPCGGTHVTNISEIGTISIRKIKSKKGKVKISYNVS